MDGVFFRPWEGSRYRDRGLHNLQILLVGESHYFSEKDTPTPETTIDVVKALGQEKRHRFFTTTAKFLLFKQGHISNKERADFWEHVSFYNFIQESVGTSARVRPTTKMWETAREPFLKTVNALNPNLIVILGKELSYHIPALPNAFTVCVVHHPSSGFSYNKAWQTLKDKIQEANGRVTFNCNNEFKHGINADEVPKLTADEINDIMRAAFPDSLDDLAMVQKVKSGGATTCLKILPCHMRPGGMISGPTQMTMVDHAAYAAIFTLTGLSETVVTANINIDFLRPCIGDYVYATAEVIEVGTRSHKVDVKVYTTSANTPCSRATVTYVLPRAKH